MRASAIGGYVGSDRIRLGEQPEPGSGAGEVLVRHRAASFNPVD
jgi:NADPH:quinone reductase-like Zn-dependent oxidoreductase